MSQNYRKIVGFSISSKYNTIKQTPSFITFALFSKISV